MPVSAPKSLAKLSTSAARKRPEVLAQLADLLGIAREDVEAWLEPIHGRTKLIAGSRSRAHPRAEQLSLSPSLGLDSLGLTLQGRF